MYRRQRVQGLGAQGKARELVLRVNRGAVPVFVVILLLVLLRYIIHGRCLRCSRVGNRGRDSGPVQHNPDHGQLHVAGTGNAAGGHAERVEVQRGAVDTRLPGRVRGESGTVHAG